MLGRRRFIAAFIRAGAILPFCLARRDVALGAAAPEASVSLSLLGAPWSVAEVEFEKEIKTHRGPRVTSFPGYVIRFPEAVGRKLNLKLNLYAISRICPHEGCQLNFHKERSEISGPLPISEFANPMLFCPCHQSVFDLAQGGKVLTGPAPRPPWVFDFVVQKGRVIIKDLEPGGDKWG
jgi:Rieske Fe-S protein